MPRARLTCAQTLAAIILAGTLVPVPARSQATIGGALAWGDNSQGQCNIPPLPTGLSYVELACGEAHTVARRSDGSVVAWGHNYYGQCNVPTLPSGVTYVEVDAAGYHSVARRSDGLVVAWGFGGQGANSVPPLPPGLTYVEVAAGGSSISEWMIARRSDGSVITWGNASPGNVPGTLPPGATYVEVAAGTQHAVVRRSDGAVIPWGVTGYASSQYPPPPPFATYVEIDAGTQYTVARLSFGGLMVWGSSFVTTLPPLPPGTVYAGIAAGTDHIVALRSNGTAVGWGWNAFGQCNVPSLPPGVYYTHVAAGMTHSAALYSSSTFPTVSGIEPARSSLVGGVPITVTGTGFTPSTTVYIGGASILNKVFVDSQHITGATPALSSPQNASILVSNLSGTSIGGPGVVYDHAVLNIIGVPHVGGTFTVGIASYPSKPLIFLGDAVPGPTPIGPYGYAGVGLSSQMLVALDYFGAFTHVPDPAAILDAAGQWSSPVNVPPIPGLVGTTVYGQAYAFSFSPFPPNTLFFPTNTLALTFVP